MLEKAKDFLYHTFLLTAGSVFCAFAVKTVLVPFGFLSSGLTGLALIVYYKNQLLPVGLLYLLINIPVFFLGLKLVGLRFILYTGWGLIIYSAMLFMPEMHLPVTDKLLAAGTAGVLSGVGSAIMFRSYGSAGGSEIVCIILHKFTGITIGTGTIIVNAIILTVSAFLFPLESILYTLVYIVISAKVTDIVFHGFAKRQAVLIVSDLWSEIVDDMNEKNHLGSTLLQGKGSFFGDEKMIIYSVINRADVVPLKKLVMKKDPAAFITIMEASDVTGENVGNQPHW